jgi:NADH dehydrogenase
MQEIHPRLAAFATRELRRRGIEVRTGTRLASVEADRATLSDGETIPTRTLCWTTGVKPNPVVAELGLELDEGGRVVVDSTMRAAGLENVWAIGDAAAVPDPATRGDRPSPPTAQHALRQGRRVADNVAAALGHGKVRPFRYRTLGVFVDMGRHKAVATVVGLRLRGFPAWFLARTYHLAMTPGTARKLRLMLDWTVGLLFGRDAVELGQLGHPPSLSGFGERPSLGLAAAAERRAKRHRGEREEAGGARTAERSP